MLVLAPRAFAAPPSFTGEEIRAQGPSTLVNLRGQGVIAGTAPINVQVNAVRVGGVLSPLINVLRAILQPGVDTTVCVEVTNLLGLDLTFLGVEIDVTAFNAEAPNGVSGRIRVRSGIGGEDVSPLACADAVTLPPTANAGPDQQLPDTDRLPGELVTLNGTASSDPDGDIVSYVWTNAAGQTIATGATALVRLPDGLHTITLTVTDATGAAASDTVNISVTAPAANQLPIANAGGDRVVPDTDGREGEDVSLDGTASRDPDGTIVSYEWLVGTNTLLATGATATVRLPDGPHQLTLRVTDDVGGIGLATVTITVGAADVAVMPIANAGGDRTVPDTNGVAGETVVLDGSASNDLDGEIVSYEWFIGSQLIAEGVSPTVVLGDGENFVTLVVTDDQGNTGSDAVLINVLPPAQTLPIADAGPDLSIDDTDGESGELVRLDGSASTDPDGTIVTYRWMLNGLQIASGSTPTVRLPDGDNVLTLVVIDDAGNSASDTVLISVARPPFLAILSALPGLSENQRSVAVALDTMCPRLASHTEPLSGDRLDLLRHCNAITFGSTADEQRRALEQIAPEELNVARTHSLDFSRTQLMNVSDRLVALRKGAKGLSLIGLSISTQDGYIPVDQVASSLHQLLGGGASADDARESLFDDRLGLWLRGNYSLGSKDESSADRGFEADQWGLVSGIDYRVTSSSVIGLSVGYGRSQVDFKPAGTGELATSALSAALYATMYSKSG
ncbi:MAG TPA: PKD domain-containing protein, partial [Steroidobacteraceae bacterium]